MTGAAKTRDLRRDQLDVADTTTSAGRGVDPASPVGDEHMVCSSMVPDQHHREGAPGAPSGDGDPEAEKPKNNRNDRRALRKALGILHVPMDVPEGARRNLVAAGLLDEFDFEDRDAVAAALLEATELETAAEDSTDFRISVNQELVARFVYAGVIDMETCSSDVALAEAVNEVLEVLADAALARLSFDVKRRLQKPLPRR